MAAFNVLVASYQRRVYNFCLRMLNSQQLAEDATQETFIAAYRHVRRFKGISFRTWLFRIAANQCYDEMRRRRSRPAVSLDARWEEGDRALDVPDRGPAPSEQMEKTELAAVVQAALLSLPTDQRTAVVLRDLQGFAYEEIAEIMKVSLGTVKSRINRGRNGLREALMEKRELLPFSVRPSSEGH